MLETRALRTGRSPSQFTSEIDLSLRLSRWRWNARWCSARRSSATRRSPSGRTRRPAASSARQRHPVAMKPPLRQATLYAYRGIRPYLRRGAPRRRYSLPVAANTP